ncbi:MAG: GNAT family N-acetyltransferase [Bacteroidales bacterium]|nr:GNAT family N-acetyltransferase [Bacteroidales bacterium]
MQEIIPPVEKALLESELTKDKYVRKTNNGNNVIYIFDHRNGPNLMQEIGRLREITFRDAGGGTGLGVDVDEFDLGENPFRQLIVWNPEEKEIIGGYRFGRGNDIVVTDKGEVMSPTAELFDFSEKFILEYLPWSIELGRSFVQPNYQPQFNLRKGMYSLDNLWDGLGAIVIDHPEIKYLFGKVTMYPHYDHLARDLVLYFLLKFFPDHERLLVPKESLPLRHAMQYLDSIFTGATYEENFKILVQQVRARNENVPPLVNAYMSLSSTMKTFGTALNRSFGDVEETGIIVTISDIYDFKKDRHIATYKKE